jgi:putative protease
MYDDDLPVMRETIDAAQKYGVSAIIASDLSALEYARSKNIEIHISTQQNISNIEAVKFFSKYADVMVLARELSIDQITAITTAIDNENIVGPSGNKIQIEIFAHGALCVAISGKCYLSLHHYNHSANRGECLQICRRAYEVKDKETGEILEIDNEYIMSPKDLCTIDFLDKIINAGVKILKIEGRARSAEYVKTVCSCYDQAIHAICENTYTPEKITQLNNKLTTVFNRGFWGGYYLGKPLGEWSNVYGSKATKRKVYIGKVNNYFSNIKVGEFIVETGTLSIGDEIIIMGPTTGVIESIVKEIRVDLKPVNETKKGERFSMIVEEMVRRSDKIYKLVENK